MANQNYYYACVNHRCCSITARHFCLGSPEHWQRNIYNPISINTLEVVLGDIKKNHGRHEQY